MLFFFSNLFNLFTIPFLTILLFLGMLLVGWGIVGLGKYSYSPFPSPKKTNILIRHGAYKYIRHPIYSGLIIISLSFLLSKFIFIPTIVFFLFVILTNIKADLEENLMIDKYPEYKEYRKLVQKYVPYFY
jgi:protein-S-isoprenylcysteine O-methyltransferase Ste14